MWSFQIHRVLGSCGFQWCVFHLCTFSKNSPNIQLIRFSLHKWRNSFNHSFWVTNDLQIQVLWIWFLWIFGRPRKMNEQRTWCSMLFNEWKKFPWTLSWLLHLVIAIFWKNYFFLGDCLTQEHFSRNTVCKTTKQGLLLTSDGTKGRSSKSDLSKMRRVRCSLMASYQINHPR